MTLILNEKNFLDIKKAASILKKGGIVIFPTDTVYGIGVSINDSKAIENLYKVIKRPKDKPTGVLISNYKQLDNLVLEIPNPAKILMEKFWPGSLSIIFKASKKVPKLVMGGKNKIGIRMPGSQVIMDLIDNLGVPIVTSSANILGEKPPSCFKDILKNLVKKADVAVKGEVLLEKESTFIDITAKPFIILREGVISKGEIKEVLEGENEIR